MIKRIPFVLVWFVHFSFGQSNISQVSTFIESLNESQKEQILFEFGDPERLIYSRYPGERTGLVLGDLTKEQKVNFHLLLRTFLTNQGYMKFLSVTNLESIVHEYENVLNREQYWIAIFGQPKNDLKWDLRFEGHHFSVHFSLIGDVLIATTPFIIGAYPNQVKDDGFITINNGDYYRYGHYILYNEEKIAKRLVSTFNEEQASIAVETDTENTTGLLSEQAPNEPIEARGILFAQLNSKQKFMLEQLIDEYVSNFYLKPLINKSKLRFYFRGSILDDQPHYYLIADSNFIIEYENLGNHIHAYYRLVNKDFGN